MNHAQIAERHADPNRAPGVQTAKAKQLAIEQQIVSAQIRTVEYRESLRALIGAEPRDQVPLPTRQAAFSGLQKRYILFISLLTWRDDHERSYPTQADQESFLFPKSG